MTKLLCWTAILLLLNESVQAQTLQRIEIFQWGIYEVDGRLARSNPPDEVEHLLQIVAIKSLCRRANVEKIEAGPKGAVLSFRDNTFADPDRLVAFIRDQGPAARVRPDMKVVFFDDWELPQARLRGTAAILRNLVALAQPAKAA